MFARNVSEADLGVCGFLRREDLGERIDALVRDAHGAESDLSAEPDRDVETLHRVEAGRLPGAGKSYQSDFHSARESIIPPGLAAGRRCWSETGGEPGLG